ncbi:type IV pilus twitching motility protein PilT [Tepidibacter aestuarii]|uniref:type IV pilus twitching motility protein PilT n=1 Tax=Tepidibacter aestuarii TaxID=2925782 RepID=UPI0020BF9EC0|nr:type IV pilus twitching motility protein PilT [Tepidibacter aestuarii]CAH2214676.1 Type IV pilus retractation ATPase PilT [Tepidibacter aestuarii]
MNIYDLLKKTIELGASDLHITVGYQPVMRINGKLSKYGEDILLPDDNLSLVKQILDEEKFKKLEEKGEMDTSISYHKLGRFRVNIYKQRGTYCMAIRSVALEIPSMEILGLPPIIKELSKKQRGLVLVTGPTGSGKSTTLASMIDYINKNRSAHILTLEDPIEYLHKHNKSIVNQREIGTDSKSFSNALRSSLRQDPDVILVGEMRDLETISIALTAAETGHLVFSTLHTIGAAKTIDRIIDAFPSHQQPQILVQLSAVLEGVVSQQLIQKEDGSGRVAALEVMVVNTAIRNLIREGKTHQIQTSIQTGTKFGMQTMDSDLRNLYLKGIISRESLLTYAVDKDMVSRYI